MHDEWDPRSPLRTYETVASPPSDISYSIVLARLTNLKGSKALARVLIQHEETDKAYSPFGGKVPFYTGPVLQYIPLSGKMTYPVPEIADGEKFFPGNLVKGKDYVDAKLLREGVLVSYGMLDKSLSKKLVLRYTDPKGVGWRIRGYPTPPKGMTKQVIGWTDQYDKDGKEVLLEGDTYNEVVSAIQAYQASRPRNIPDMATLSPFPYLDPNLYLYILNQQQTFSDGETVYNVYKVKDDTAFDDRENGLFYAIAEAPGVTKVIGPAPNINALQGDVVGSKQKGMRAELFGSPSLAQAAEGLKLSSDRVDSPKSLQESDLEQYLPWIGLGLGAVAVGTVLYMASRRRS